MRAGPLADPKVIALLNGHFACVYVSNEVYQKDGSAPAEERKAYEQIYHEALREKRAAGSVCVYLVDPDGKGFASLIVSDAARPGRLQKLLEQAVARFKVARGKPLVAPAPQAPPPPAAADALVLHVVARYEHRGKWAEFPAENYVVLKPAEWARLLPPGPAKVGAVYTIDRAVAARVLTYFFPQTETCDFAKMLDANGPYQHRIEQLKLTGRVISNRDGRARVRLEGAVRLKHKFYPGRDDNNYADATVLGFIDTAAAKKKPPSLWLVSDRATYGKEKWGKFGVAVRPVR